MTDISNKSLAGFLVIALVVSVTGAIFTFTKLGGDVWSTTGFAAANTTGKTNFSIQSSFSIKFNNNLIAFGTGYVNSSNGCQMGTNNSPPQSTPNGCFGFNQTVNATNLTIENDGNVRANISLNFTANATGFIGGAAPSFQYMVSNLESGSCGAIGNGTTFQEVGNLVVGNKSNDTNLTGSRICTNLNFTDVSDLIQIGVWVNISQTVSQGAHEVVITAIACDDGTC